MKIDQSVSKPASHIHKEQLMKETTEEDMLLTTKKND